MAESTFPARGRGLIKAAPVPDLPGRGTFCAYGSVPFVVLQRFSNDKTQFLKILNREHVKKRKTH